MTEETKQIGEMETQQASLVRLPLWKNCVERMLANGVEYGKTYSAEYLEKELRCKRTEMNFGIAVSEIRRALETRGFYLSGRGLKGDSFIILEPQKNQEVLSSYSTTAIDALKRGVILGTNTRLDTLTSEERRRHESMLHKMATRLMLMKHSAKISKTIEKHDPKLLRGEEKV
jgi:hypothetical protein